MVDSANTFTVNLFFIFRLLQYKVEVNRQFSEKVKDMSGLTTNKLRSANNYSDKMKFNMLTTDWNVISHFHFVQEKMKMEDLRFVNNRFPTFNEVKNEVIKDIKTIWTSSSLPYVSVKRIEEQLKLLLYDFKKEKKKASKSGADVECVSFLPF